MLAFELEQELAPALVAIGCVSADGKPLLTIKLSESLVKDKNLHAGNLAREMAQRYLKGGGGGQPTFATAGGSEAKGIAEAIAAIGQMA